MSTMNGPTSPIPRVDPTDEELRNIIESMLDAVPFIPVCVPVGDNQILVTLDTGRKVWVTIMPEAK